MRYFNSSPEVIRLVVLMYVRFPLSLRSVEHLLFERDIVSYEDVTELMMTNLANDGPFGRRRVSIALPRGERGLRSQLPAPE